MREETARAMIPEMPQPSSRMVDEWSRTLCENRRLEGDDSQDAMEGVIFQTTETFSGWKRGEDGKKMDLPAPVVPPPRFDERTVGD